MFILPLNSLRNIFCTLLIISGGYAATLRSATQDPEDEENFRLFYTNNEIHGICKTVNVSNFVRIQQRKYASHLVRARTYVTKMLFFQEDKMQKTW